MRLLTVCLFLLFSPLVQAANFSVTNNSDSGAGSLRQAIIDANASGAVPHIIVFSPGYTQFDTIILQSDLPVINASDVRIRGSDRAPVIDGGGLYSIFRAAQNISLEIEDLNMQYGLNDSGGCISTAVNSGTGTLLVQRSYFFQCKAVDSSFPGGGAINWNAGSPGSLTVNDSGFFENTATSTNIATEQPRGGAIQSSANTIIRRSVFKDNATFSAGDRGGYGGAISLFLPDPSGVSEISDSRFESNSTDTETASFSLGGGVRTYIVPGALLMVERNFFLDNKARQGGGLYVSSQMLSTTTQISLANNTFVENTAELDGGAIKFEDMEVFANHNTFYKNSGTTGSHLSFERVKMRSLVHNVLAITEINSACQVSNVSIISADLTNNLFIEACDILSSTGGSISANLEVQEVDKSQRVGVAKFVSGADPIDGGSTNLSQCAATDAQGTTRPLDGDNDDTAICDVGAFEAPSDTLFKDGFES